MSAPFELDKFFDKAIDKPLDEKVEMLVTSARAFEQAPCPVRHIFLPGRYIREITIPAGTIVVGHYHKEANINVLAVGGLAIVNEDGSVSKLYAPYSFISDSGKRKCVYALEDTIFLNVYNTDETNVGVLENQYVDKTKYDLQLFYRPEHTQLLTTDVKQEHSPVEVRTLFPFVGDLEQLPFGIYKVAVFPNPQAQMTVYASAFISQGEVIAPLRINGQRTLIGRYLQHSSTPNAEIKQSTNGDLCIVAKQNIDGMFGGIIGEEVCIDYSHYKEV